MITAQALKARRATGAHLDDEDWAAAERLKEDFVRWKAERDPFYLTREDFFRVARWKLITQFGRVRHLLDLNSSTRIERVTHMALTFCDDDPDFEDSTRVAILRTLPGVGMAVASAVLAMWEPTRYAPIDFRVWRQLFATDVTEYEYAEYRRYMTRLRELAAELSTIDPANDWPVQLVDYFTWEHDATESAASKNA